MDVTVSDFIPKGNKFSCIALRGVPCTKQEEPVQLRDGLSIHYKAPFSLDNQWKGWLGEFRYQHLAESNFLILATSQSSKPDILDEEHRVLEERVYQLFYAIIMHGVPHYHGAVVVTGANVDGLIEARKVTTPYNYYKMEQVAPLEINTDIIRNAELVALGIRTIYEEKNHFHRLRRGMHAWILAVREIMVGERLHQFVRTIEALVKPGIGKTKRHFIHRCQTFAQDSSNDIRKLLEEIYEIRSAIEHLNTWETALNHIPENERECHGLFRSYQGELLAGQTYIRLLSDEDLLTIFQTDESIEKFWKLKDHDRRTRWGIPIDLERLASKRFAPL
jgi:hypothetical protein